jgi:HlyD family secretion protein
MKGRLAAVGLLAACLARCSVPGPTAAERAGAAGVELVVRRDTLQERVLLTGELQAVRAERIVVPATPEWELPIRWIERDGTLVAEGQKVVELDNTPFASELEQKRLAATGAHNDLMSQQADGAIERADKAFAVERVTIELQRARLRAEVPPELLAERDYQERQLALARAEAELAKAAGELESIERATAAAVEERRIALERARDAVAIAEKAIRDLTLLAPRAGLFVVAENRQENRKYQVGDSVWVGLAVAEIPDLEQMQVVARLSDVDDGRVAVGMSARCTLDTYPEQVFTGSVSEIAPIAQEESERSLRRSFRVVIRLDGSDVQRMRPGMSVKAEILPEAAPAALLVPRAALEWAAGSPRALRHEDGTSEEVRLGPCNATHCVAEQGLEEGTRLRARS